MSKINHFLQLTEREQEILHLLADGLCNKLIADRLSITVRTVKFHTNNIYTKLAVGSRAEAISWVWKQQVTRFSGDD